MKTRKISLTGKSKWTSFAMVAAIGAGMLALPASALAVAGQCSLCHTMHNSQNNQPMNYDASTTPNETLLRGDCMGCHTGENDAGTGSTHAPFVMATAAPTYGPSATQNNTLAGGNFWWVEQGDDRTGHNTTSQDGVLGNVPPGGTAALIGSANNVTCAGATGCHGDRSVTGDMAGIAGGHHGNVRGQITGTPTTVGGSYRFLVGVTGLEDDDYQYTYSSTDHNEYKGAARSSEGTLDETTISSLCAQCHPDFHNNDATFQGTLTLPGIVGNSSWGGPWVRHPTDYDMNETDATSEYQAYTTYSVEAPVGRTTIAATASATVNGAAGDAIVLCVSCHRAHGSPNPDLLRWSYSDMVAGSGFGNTGCFTCHTTKDDVL